MKKIVLALITLLCGMDTNAQVVRLYKNGTLVGEYDQSAVDKVEFGKASDSSTDDDGHAYVDLGLPSGTLWATCNIGATSPEQYGNYYAWGETKSKTTYDWTTYALCNKTAESMTKYCLEETYGKVDNKSELEATDDAASNWNSNWHMPSLTQMQELINTEYTTSTFTQLNGVSGILIISKRNNNSIFLPAAGYYDGNTLNRAGTYCNYWTCSLANYSNTAYYLDYDSKSIYTSSKDRCLGQSIRPVRMK